MQVSAAKTTTATFDEVREVLTTYMVGMLGQPVTLTAKSLGYRLKKQMSAGIEITLPDRIDNHPSYQMNLDRYWMLAAMQGAGVLYGSNEILQKNLRHFEKILGMQKHWSTDYTRFYELDDYFGKAFGQLASFVHEIYNSVETARLRYRLGQDFPGIDAKIEAVVTDALRNGGDSMTASLDGFLRRRTHDTQGLFSDKDGKQWSPEMLMRLWTALFSKDLCKELISTHTIVEKLYTKMADVLFVEHPTMRQSLHATAIAVKQLLPRGKMESDIRAGRPPVDRESFLKSNLPKSAGASISMGFDMPPPVMHDLKRSRERSSGKYVYDEWNHMTKTYRKSGASVKEVLQFPPEHLPGGKQQAMPNVRIHPSLVTALQKELGILLPEGRTRELRQLKGTLHLPSLVRYLTRQRAGLQPDPRVCYRWMETTRDVAATYLIDTSRSTVQYPNQRALAANMRTIDMMQQGLLHFLLASEALGDDYGVYAYQSGVALGDHQHTYLVTVKDLFTEQPYPITRDKLLSIIPNEDNRDGAALRHILYQKLAHHPAKTKLLIHLNDGMPEHGLKYPSIEYGGQYALEDTKKALDEAKANGIIPLSFSYAFGKDKDSLRALWGDSITFVESPKELSKALSRALLMHTAE